MTAEYQAALHVSACAVALHAKVHEALIQQRQPSQHKKLCMRGCTCVTAQQLAIWVAGKGIGMPSGSGNADFRAGPSQDQKAAAARQRQQLVADLQQQVGAASAIGPLWSGGLL